MVLQDPDAATGRSRLKRVVLIGDHHQLPPVVKNAAFQKYSRLDQSLFARFVRLGVPVTQLNMQGRARPKIADLYRWRYEALGDLSAVADAKYTAANPGFAHAFQFVDVADLNGVGESSPMPYYIQNLAVRAPPTERAPRNAARERQTRAQRARSTRATARGRPVWPWTPSAVRPLCRGPLCRATPSAVDPSTPLPSQWTPSASRSRSAPARRLPPARLRLPPPVWTAQEAEFVVATFMYMRLIGIAASRISIITTYNGQRDLIEDIMRQRCSTSYLYGSPAKSNAGYASNPLPPSPPPHAVGNSGQALRARSPAHAERHARACAFLRQHRRQPPMGVRGRPRPFRSRDHRQVPRAAE